MSVIGSNILAGASGQGGGYNLTNSLRFRQSASARLTRTPASAGNRRTYTWSGWVKRGTLTVPGQTLFDAYSGGNDRTHLQFDNFQLRFFNNVSGSIITELRSTQVFRDPSAWYHFVLAVDTTQATASNRVKLYVNGSLITALATATYQNQNTDTYINATNVHDIGVGGAYAEEYFDGYLTEVNFIDGQALTPSSFGETSATTGVWIPKKYTGTYGTNGFYLPFTDNSALTTSSNAGLGKDFSGNANYWTTNNISITSGSTYDSMTDVPTLTSATVANYCVLNPLDNPSTSNSLANANLTPSTAGASGWKGIRSTMAFPTTGKWYYEVTLTSGTDNLFLGIVSKDASGVYHDHADTFAVRMSDCTLRPSGATATGTQASYAVGDVFGVAIDCSTPTVQFYKNGSLNVTYTSPSFDPSKTYFPCFMGNDTGASATHNYNFGQRPFTYTAPANYLALNTFNLPTPTIGATASTQANKYFDVSIYTGTGALTQSVINSNSMQPDFVWVKDRSQSTRHVLTDSVRGSGISLYSNTTDLEGTNDSTGYLSAFNSNGFTLNRGSGGLGERVNYNNDAYVGWQWRASNATAVTNTAGTITSTVSANTTAGFSIVTYTGNATSSQTVGHGLGVTPTFIIIKKRSASDTWNVYSVAGGVTGNTILQLNTTDATVTGSNINITANSTTIGFGSASQVNGSGATFVCYAFAPVAGYSAFGSYTGNGSTDGPFVYTGFRPKFLILKRTDAGADAWIMADTSIQPYNVVGNFLQPSQADAELYAVMYDFLSNGFKLRQTYTTINSSGATYIYMAFAENPFKYSLAR